MYYSYLIFHQKIIINVLFIMLDLLGLLCDVTDEMMIVKRMIMERKRTMATWTWHHGCPSHVPSCNVQGIAADSTMDDNHSLVNNGPWTKEEHEKFLKALPKSTETYQAVANCLKWRRRLATVVQSQTYGSMRRNTY